MSILCSQCAHENPDQSTFCIRCGNRLQSTGQFSNTGPSSSQSLPPYAATVASVPPSLAYAPPPPIPPYSSPSSASSYLSHAPASQGAAPISSYPIQMGTGQGQASLRRAFAGCGTLIFHHSWLISGGSEQTVNARATILEHPAPTQYPWFQRQSAEVDGTWITHGGARLHSRSSRCLHRIHLLCSCWKRSLYLARYHGFASNQHRSHCLS